MRDAWDHVISVDVLRVFDVVGGDGMKSQLVSSNAWKGVGRGPWWLCEICVGPCFCYRAKHVSCGVCRHGAQVRRRDGIANEKNAAEVRRTFAEANRTSFVVDAYSFGCP